MLNNELKEFILTVQKVSEDDINILNAQLKEEKNTVEIENINSSISFRKGLIKKANELLGSN